MLYILHGDDEFTRAEKVAELRAQVLAEGMGDLNISVQDGRQLDLVELINICNTVPFLSTQRLVIVENLLQREPVVDEDSDESTPPVRRPSIVPGLLEYLPHMPASTHLALVENRTLKTNHPLLKACRKFSDFSEHVFKRPSDNELPRWIAQRAARHGVRIAPQAAALLAQYVSPRSSKSSRDDDLRPVLRTLDTELAKLAAYQDYAGTVTAEDVRALVNRAHQDDIFALVDALGTRQTRRAMQLLREMLDGGHKELYLLAMVSRQVRLIISAKDLADRERPTPDDLARTLRVHSFVAGKLLDQARRFTMEALIYLHRQVTDTEFAIKTGANASLALEMLVLEICQRRDR